MFAKRSPFTKRYFEKGSFHQPFLITVGDFLLIFHQPLLRMILKKADEPCRKTKICITLIFLQFSSAFFCLLGGILKKADELCRKTMICVTLIFLQFSSAFFWLLGGILKKGDELCRKIIDTEHRSISRDILLCSVSMICVTLIFLQFSSAFFWLLRRISKS